jgi:CheY-like chemotaxis protein
MREEQVKCEESGMNDIVLKPFDKNTLLRKMDSFIKMFKEQSN